MLPEQDYEKTRLSVQEIIQKFKMEQAAAKDAIEF
jgi:hypothetical protein